jgi:type II secretion system protein G
MNLPHKKSGFTLIELLVVVSIIGLLASIILASLSGARAKARDSARVQSLVQLRTALEFYRNKHGEYPQTGNGMYADDITQNSDDFTQVLNVLVTEKNISKLPDSSDIDHPIVYGATHSLDEFGSCGATTKLPYLLAFKSETKLNLPKPTYVDDGSGLFYCITTP